MARERTPGTHLSWWRRWRDTQIRRIASVGAKVRVGEVTALVIVVANTETFQLGEVNVKSTTAIVHVLTIQCLQGKQHTNNNKQY